MKKFTSKVNQNYSKSLKRVDEIPVIPIINNPTSIEKMSKLQSSISGAPRLLVKRDDAIPFGFGGNKIRKLEMVAADAQSFGADTLVTVGGVQSNHARATAAVAARLRLHCHLILNGQKPAKLTGNTLLDDLLGANIDYVKSRDDRLAAMDATVEKLQQEGRIPYAIPLGASTPLGALGFVRAIGEMLAQTPAPDVIIHACSSGGTLAGLAAGCRLHGIGTQVIGISADDPADEIEATVGEIIEGMGKLLECDGKTLAADCQFKVDDQFVGEGYGKPTRLHARGKNWLPERKDFLWIIPTQPKLWQDWFTIFVKDTLMKTKPSYFGIPVVR